LIAEGLWGIAVSAIAATAAMFAVRLARSGRASRLWLATFVVTCLAAALLVLRLNDLSVAVFCFALCGNALCVLMLYALITRSISFDLLAVVATHRATGVNEQTLLGGDPLNVRERLGQLVRMRLVVTDRARYRTSRLGTLLSRALVEPLYLVRRNEP
jgi:hypothetical protein